MVNEVRQDIDKKRLRREVEGDPDQDGKLQQLEARMSGPLTFAFVLHCLTLLLQLLQFSILIRISSLFQTGIKGPDKQASK